MKPLPAAPFEYAEWKSAKVHPDYHVEVEKTFYSVPHRLIGRTVEVRLTHRVVEIFHDHQRVASHVRRSQRSGHVTVNEHMPKAHQRYANTTPASLISRAARIGPNAAILVERMMRDRPHPEQGYRSAMGILSLAPRYGPERLDAACERALLINAIAYSSVTAILKAGLDRASSAEPAKPTPQTPTSAAPPLPVKEKERMLTNPTLDQMQALGLAGMAAAWRELAERNNANELSRDEWLGLMLDREVAMRADKRVRNRLASARLRFPEACIEDIDFAAPRGLDRRSTMALAQGEWLKTHENLIVTGQTGTGKSWLACAFGRQAARLDHSVLYVRVPRLFEDLALARLDGRFPRLIDKLTRAQLLILDDFGTHSLTDQQRFHLFEIVEERYRRKSTLITAQLQGDAGLP